MTIEQVDLWKLLIFLFYHVLSQKWTIHSIAITARTRFNWEYSQVQYVLRWTTLVIVKVVFLKPEASYQFNR